MERLWKFFNVDWEIAVRQALQGIQLLVCTVDVYLKIQAKDTGGGPIHTIFRAVNPVMALVDEVQRVRDFALFTLAGSLPNIVCLGDPLQKVPRFAARPGLLVRSPPFC